MHAHTTDKNIRPINNLHFEPYFRRVNACKRTIHTIQFRFMHIGVMGGKGSFSEEAVRQAAEVGLARDLMAAHETDMVDLADDVRSWG